jgi:hypothetical protein
MWRRIILKGNNNRDKQWEADDEASSDDEFSDEDTDMIGLMRHHEGSDDDTGHEGSDDDTDVFRSPRPSSSSKTEEARQGLRAVSITS